MCILDASGSIDSEELDVMLRGLFTMAGVEWDAEVRSKAHVQAAKYLRS